MFLFGEPSDKREALGNQEEVLPWAFVEGCLENSGFRFGTFGICPGSHVGGHFGNARAATAAGRKGNRKAREGRPGVLGCSAKLVS